MNNRKIVLAVAPTGGWGGGRNNPITPKAVAREVIACADAGATVVHLHARNTRGELTTDLAVFARAVAGIKAGCDIILEASTGGLSDFSPAERILPVSNPQAEMGSLNIGSFNFGDAVYRNSLPDVHFWIEGMQRAGVKPSLEVFDTGHLETARHLVEEGLVAAPANVSFIFGVRWGMTFDPRLLSYLTARLPAQSRWGAILVGSRDFRHHLTAAQAGATVLRTGFEDSIHYGGRLAASNVELVGALRGTLEDAGFSIASVAEARALLLENPPPA
jgi:3-keto-5-aminohexanoate cleavage enzyme